MILLDTNVLIDAFRADSPFHEWARSVIAEHVSAGGAAINAVCLAELCVGEADPASAAERIRRYGVSIMDLPSACAAHAGSAYQHYRSNRKAAGREAAPKVPLPDFLIGAHALVMEWPLATSDRGRFQTYFPDLQLLMPPRGRDAS